MNILFLDLETSPNLGWVWALWQQDVGLSQIESTTEVICFAAKWLGKSKVHFFSTHHDGKKRMVKEAHALLDEADAVVSYNGTRFDIPHLNREILQAGLRPPAPFKEIDLWSVVKRRFNFPSNKLAYVAPALGLEDKVKHEGFELWRRCLKGDQKAWATMKRYNVQDVRLLEQLYDVLLPWIPNHPSRRLYDNETKCPTCGSGDLQRRGQAFTKTSRYQRWVCKECGSWFRDTHRNKAVALTSV
jgi:hypothetical protein